MWLIDNITSDAQCKEMGETVVGKNVNVTAKEVVGHITINNVKKRVECEEQPSQVTDMLDGDTKKRVNVIRVGL